MYQRIIKSFFLRSSMVMVLLSLVGSIIVYRYMHLDFRSNLTSEMKTYIEAAITKYPDSLSHEFQQRKDEIESDARGLMREMDFLLMEIYDEKHMELLELHSKSKRFIDILHKLTTDHDDLIIHDFPQGNKLVYNFFETEGNAFLQVFYPLINKEGAKIGYIEGITLVQPLIVDQFKRGVLTTIITIIGSVLVLSLTIFPLVYMAYKELRQKSIDLLYSNIQIIRSLGNAVAQRDSDTNEHNYRVTLYAIKLAEALELSHPLMQALIQGSFLHDVGKIGISDSILLKPGKLNDEEFEVMKTHVTKGMEIIKDIKWLNGSEAIIGFHHEKFDGSGYMQGLNGEQIPIIARIFAIVDVFDALTSKRPYKEPVPYEKTIKILEEGSGSHFDPQILEKFISLSHTLYQETVRKDHIQLKEELFSYIEHYFL